MCKRYENTYFNGSTLCQSYSSQILKTCTLSNIISRREELDGPAVFALQRAIAEVKQRCSVIGWVTKNLLSRAPPCFGRHVKPLVPAAFAVSTHQPALGPRGGLRPVLLMYNP
jgi:hypothetical protein